MIKPACIIVGGGQAAAQTALSLRQEGWQGRVVVVSNESTNPYQRPPLSKAFLAGQVSKQEIYIRPARVYSEAGIDLLLGTSVSHLDRQNRLLFMDDGSRLSYDRLVLATGSKARQIKTAGNQLRGICYLRSLQDAGNIRDIAGSARHVVIVGAGYIGLETASILVRQGLQVTVLEMAERILQRVTSPVVSEFFTRVHREAGVNIVCGSSVAGFDGHESLQAVHCSGGDSYPADIAIIGIGVVPDTGLADAAGLQVDNGIVVDEFCRTSDPSIYAAGDCTSHFSHRYQKWIRLESVQNAVDQARTAAVHLCGREIPNRGLPWFWSDQYDIKLQIAGLYQGHEQAVVRGDTGSGRDFTVFYLADGCVSAVDAVNRPAEFMLGKQLIQSAAGVDPQRLADSHTDLRSLR